MDFAKALYEAHLNIRLNEEEFSNELYGYAQYEAKQLCEEITPKLHFTFIHGTNLQAYAVYKSDMIVVTDGLFNFLCRLADRIVSKGLFTNIGRPTEPTWTPNLDNSLRTARELIQDKPFDFASSAWKTDESRKGLFFYLLLTMFRFVVLHEMGHIYHKHGDRFNDEAAAMDIDTSQPQLLPEIDALDSQARELVADKFAIDALKKILEVEIERIKQTPFLENLSGELLASKEKREIFLLQTVYLYFSATDRLPGLSATEAIRMSHPPAAFRLVTIAATMTKHLNDEEVKHTTLAATIIGDSLISVALDRNPDPDWLVRMQDPLFSEQYKNLYQRVSMWTYNHVHQ